MKESSKSLKEIIKHIDIPVVADIHFHYREQLKQQKMEPTVLE